MAVIDLAKIAKALTPLVGGLLVAGANRLGLAESVITDDVTNAVMAFAVAIAGAVWAVPNKQPEDKR